MKAIKITITILFFVSAVFFELNAQSEKEAEEQRALILERAIPDKPSSVINYYSVQPHQSSELTFSKRFNSESQNSEKAFIINSSAKSVSLTLSGSVKEGSIQLILYKPDGEEYQVLEIDNSSDIRWRQSFSMDKEAEKWFNGKWKIKIIASNASGNYMFRMVAQ